MSNETLIGLLENAKQLAVENQEFDLACTIRDALRLARPAKKRAPAFESDALEWLEGLKGRLDEHVSDLALEYAKERDTDVTIDIIQEAARTVIESAPTYWNEEKLEETP